MSLRRVILRVMRRSNSSPKQLQEVSRVHSTLARQSFSKKNLGGHERKERTQSRLKLSPKYIIGFVDGEGSFSVSIYYDGTMKNKIFVRPEFEIELRADDRKILERVRDTLGCGRIYNLNYEKYGWYPHVKYKVSNFKEIIEKIIPFFERYPLQSKKAKIFRYFREIVLMRKERKHLTKRGVKKIIKLRNLIRSLGKKHRLGTARVRENRSPGGVGR